ncbi:hypothetical protein TNCV_3113371 [Trichonephila clavipes]|nr:hypothetical protein TNCV_3113371 [Trichonephila clavipes]
MSNVICGCILRKSENFGRYVNRLHVMTVVLSLVLPPYTFITHSVKRRQLVELLRDLVAALWEKELAFRTRERRKFWAFTDGPQRREKKTSSEAVLQLNSA